MEENKETRVMNSQESQEMTTADVLKKIDSLRDEMSYLSGALEKIFVSAETELNLPCANEVNLVTKAEAIRDAVRARETTIQKFLALYEKVYDDCRSDQVTAGCR